MTNEDIIQKLRNGEPFDSLGNAIVLTKSDYMNEARSDERTRLIQEIEEWVKEGYNFVTVNGFGDFLLDKLNSLKNP